MTGFTARLMKHWLVQWTQSFAIYGSVKFSTVNHPSTAPDDGVFSEENANEGYRSKANTFISLFRVEENKFE